MVANWGTQASFDPWRFVVLIKNNAHTLQNLKQRGAFTINLLDAQERNLVERLMKTKGAGEAAEKGSLEAPRLARAYAGVDCKLLQVVDIGGDHALVVGEVMDGWKRRDGPALTLPDVGLNYAG